MANANNIKEHRVDWDVLQPVTMIKGEVWTWVGTIKGLEEYNDYMVSNMGRVVSTKRNKIKLLTPQQDKMGYVHVRLFTPGKQKGKYGKELNQKRNATGHKTAKLMKVHRLVALAFLGAEVTDGLVVDHLNGVKTDNRLANLEAVSQKVNMQRYHELRKLKKGIESTANAM